MSKTKDAKQFAREEFNQSSDAGMFENPIAKGGRGRIDEDGNLMLQEKATASEEQKQNLTSALANAIRLGIKMKRRGGNLDESRVGLDSEALKSALSAMNGMANLESSTDDNEKERGLESMIAESLKLINDHEEWGINKNTIVDAAKRGMINSRAKDVGVVFDKSLSHISSLASDQKVTSVESKADKIHRYNNLESDRDVAIDRYNSLSPKDAFIDELKKAIDVDKEVVKSATVSNIQNRPLPNVPGSEKLPDTDSVGYSSQGSDSDNDSLYEELPLNDANNELIDSQYDYPNYDSLGEVLPTGSKVTRSNDADLKMIKNPDYVSNNSNLEGEYGNVQMGGPPTISAEEYGIPDDLEIDFATHDEVASIKSEDIPEGFKVSGKEIYELGDSSGVAHPIYFYVENEGVFCKSFGYDDEQGVFIENNGNYEKVSKGDASNILALQEENSLNISLDDLVKEVGIQEGSDQKQQQDLEYSREKAAQQLESIKKLRNM